MLGFRIALLFYSLSLVWALDFCNMTACKGEPHLGCDNDLTFHNSCLPKRVLVNMQIYETYLVKIHNIYREEVASGAIADLPKAQQMPEMLWHWQLALLAEYHVKRCLQNLTHYCVALTNITEPGVNYGIIWKDIGSRPSYRSNINAEKITQQVDQWMHQLYKLPAADDYMEEDLTPIRNILNDRNFFLGCAAAEYYDRKHSQFILICYYDEHYVGGRSVYKDGDFLPTNCPRSRSANYAHLCKPHKEFED